MQSKEDSKVDLSNGTGCSSIGYLMDIKAASRYLGIAKSTLYKLTSAGMIAHYKPNGKLVRFLRRDLDRWLLANRISSVAEMKGGQQ